MVNQNLIGFLITDKGNPRACHVYEKLGGKNDYKDEIVYVKTGKPCCNSNGSRNFVYL